MQEESRNARLRSFNRRCKPRPLSVISLLFCHSVLLALLGGRFFCEIHLTQPPPPPFHAHRDLTINSLFYNVNTGTVEDFTGKGTSDLRLGLVRTPLPPCETLLDDPLRALRAVRFASRLKFRVHPELMEAGRDPRVHDALCTKVLQLLTGRQAGGLGFGTAHLQNRSVVKALTHHYIPPERP